MRRTRFILAGLLAGLLLVSGCSAPAAVDSGIRGAVTIAPTDGGEAVAYETEVIIKPQGGRSSVAKVKSDTQGRFEVDLEPGGYLIRAASAPDGVSLKPITVTVEANEYAEVPVPFIGVPQ